MNEEGQRERRSLADRVEALIDYGRQYPDGFTRVQAQQDLGMSSSTFAHVMQWARAALEDTGENFVCRPAGWHGSWVWVLTQDSSQCFLWLIRHRLKTARYLRTQRSVAGSGVKMGSARTRDGKYMRRIYRDLDNYYEATIEDLDELHANAPASVNTDRIIAALADLRKVVAN